MKPILFALLALGACSSKVEGSGSGGQGSGVDVPPSGGGQGGGLFTYQPCDKTCTGDCLSVPDGAQAIGICAAPCQAVSDCPAKDGATLVCSDHKCGISCATSPCPDAAMKCVADLCGYPVPAPQ